MRKNNNIKQLKEIVNNDLFFDLNHQGVQAYNISSANEYEVIVGLDFMAFVAINTMAVLARIFPSE